MRVLCVAEKPSIARSISDILSGGQKITRNTKSNFIKNYDFNYPQTNSFYTVTSVAGHLTECDFGDSYRNWHSCDPLDLFDADVEVKISDKAKDIESNLLSEARRANMLMIWTDCDREGEHIGSEVVKVCRRANRTIQVKRARFSAIIARQIHHAAQNPVELDYAQADAVEARTILDLRIGAAFTRMQTLALERRIDQLKDHGVVSYGPCQFPTLGFVVSRYTQVKAFVPEPFWHIDLSCSREDSDGVEEVKFNWKRGHLFDEEVAIVLYEDVLSNPTARVTKVVTKPTKKWKPLPLTTVELQKSGSRLLRLAPKKILDIAEGLYQKGFLSYPRTETDQFDRQFDFMSLIAKQTVDPAWGNFAQQLQNGGFATPRDGKKNDKAHPPIHPTAHAGALAGDDKRVYEFVTRRFLACCSKDAEGWETTVEVQYGEEEFYVKGLVILSRNYLVVYPYDKWSGKEIPEFKEGDEFEPSTCELNEGRTSKPNFLTEADLVTLMDKNGIGTDATIAQHIQTIIDRNYVLDRMDGQTKYLVPSTLGIGLVEGYNEIGLENSLSKPYLRRDTERSMVDVCEGTQTKQAMLYQSIELYRQMYLNVRAEFNKVTDSVRKYIEQGGQDGPDGGPGGGGRRGGGGGGGGGGPGGDADDDGGGGGGGGGGRGGAPKRGRVSRGRATATRGTRGTRGARGGSTRSSGRRSTGDSPPAGDDLEIDGSDEPSAPSRRPPPPRVQSKPKSVGAPAAKSSSDGPHCQCGVPAAKLSVTKETASKGRKFWTCGNDKVCSFFEWAIETIPEVTVGGGSVIPAKRPHSEVMSNAAASSSATGSSRKCQCNQTAALRTVVREGPNQGRQFWTCPAGKEAGCSYFEWADEHVNSVESSSYAIGNQGGSKLADACFKCGKPGHWANSCPNNGGNSSKRTKSYGAVGKSAMACFNCGEEGHLILTCPKKDGSSHSTSASKGAKLGRGGRSASGTSTRGSKSKPGTGKKKANFRAPDD